MPFFSEKGSGCTQKVKHIALTNVHSCQPSFILFFGLRHIQMVRPCHIENTSSHFNSEVKKHMVRIILGWVTAWELLVQSQGQEDGNQEVRRHFSFKVYKLWVSQDCVLTTTRFFFVVLACQSPVLDGSAHLFVSLCCLLSSNQQCCQLISTTSKFPLKNCGNAENRS